VEIDALITSVDDPQLPRCLDAVMDQTVPFSKVIHLNNVCPTSEATNQGIAQSIGGWIMHIGGDMILNKNALETAISYMDKNSSEKISGYYFGLYDTFLECKIGYISILNGELYRTLIFDDTPTCDSEIVRRIRRNGWKTVKKLNVLLGTHFDSPDEFQVFKRCYIHGIRYYGQPGKSLKIKLEELTRKKDDPLYHLGIKAIEYSEIKKYYPGSHNLTFDRKNYEEYLEGINHYSNS